MKKSKRLYSNGEEIFNGISHISGAGLGIIFTVILIVRAMLNNLDSLSIISCAVFGGSMIILYTMSSLYHMIKPIGAKRVFRIFDHCTIFLLIAGTYTPYILLCIRQLEGYIILGLVWLLAIVGITLNAINMENKYVKIYSYIAYVVMGWSIIFIYPILRGLLLPFETMFLFVGGIFYTLGLIFYGGGRKYKWWHSIWHLFVLFGSVSQFISLLFIVSR